MISLDVAVDAAVVVVVADGNVVAVGDFAEDIVLNEIPHNQR